jgi:hypothetical protein
MIYIGIDPGKSGAIAIVRPGNSEVHNFSTWKEHHAQIQAEIWGEENLDIFAVIELGQKRMGERAKSAFAFGENCGGWACLLEVLGVPREFVEASKWKKAMGISVTMPKRKPDAPKPTEEQKKRARAAHKKKLKELSIKRACELFPQMVKEIGKNDNKAEALLIAEYGRRLRS